MLLHIKFNTPLWQSIYVMYTESLYSYSSLQEAVCQSVSTFNTDFSAILTAIQILKTNEMLLFTSHT